MYLSIYLSICFYHVLIFWLLNMWNLSILWCYQTTAFSVCLFFLFLLLGFLLFVLLRGSHCHAECVQSNPSWGGPLFQVFKIIGALVKGALWGYLIKCGGIIYCIDILDILTSLRGIAVSMGLRGRYIIAMTLSFVYKSLSPRKYGFQMKAGGDIVINLIKAERGWLN